MDAANRTGRIRTDTATKSSQAPQSLKQADGPHAVGRWQIAQLWKQYFSELLNVTRAAHPDLSSIAPVNQAEQINCAPPSFDETQAMIERLKNHKAAGVDGILAESLKLGGEALTAWLHEIILGVWESERAPDEWKQA